MRGAVTKTVIWIKFDCFERWIDGAVQHTCVPSSLLRARKNEAKYLSLSNHTGKAHFPFNDSKLPLS